MRAFSNTDVLALWEAGRSLHPLDQALLGIHAAFPESRGESVADWPLGRRNRALAELRCVCFGPVLQGSTSCRQCGESIEFEMDGRALAEVEDAATHAASIEVDGQAFRLPTSRDLARIAGEADLAVASARLLDVCRIDGGVPASQSTSVPRWTDVEMEAVEEKMAQADPLAEVVLTIQCPACGDTSNESLDLPTFIWAELEARARRLLLQIHALARAYGWTEDTILALSDARLQIYFEMVQA